jgi:GTP-binding protein LepA
LILSRASCMNHSCPQRPRRYGSLDYEAGPYQVADVVQLAIKVNNDPVDAMTSMVHRDKAERLGRQMCTKLRDILPRQQYQV